MFRALAQHLCIHDENSHSPNFHGLQTTLLTLLYMHGMYKMQFKGEVQ